MFITKQTKAGDYLLIKNYTPGLYGAPGRHRIRRMRDTPKAMEKYNNHRKAEKLQMLILNNFDKGFHVTLDYPKGARPETYEEAEKNLTKCLYKISRRLKRKGQEFKYIAVTERGKRAAALHHHLIIEGRSEVLEELTSVWGNHMKVSKMYEEGNYEDLAEYFCKIETKEESTKGKSKYHRSRNLKEPDVRTALCAGSIHDEPYIPKGYQLVPDSLVNGFNEIIGIRYQRYMLKRDCKGAEIRRNKSKYAQVPQKGAPSASKGNLLKRVFDGFKGIFKRGGKRH